MPTETRKTTGFGTRLEQAAAKTSLEPADIARVIGTNPRTVSRWISEEVEPRRDARERLLELIAVLERLSAILRPSSAHDWLFMPNPELDNYKPVDLLERGEFRAVLGAIDTLAEGVFV
jgi:putative toxin-antitoxin system antitoxin component (TIGR02293 family)